MNSRITKEIRVLLPAFGLTLSASALPILWPKGPEIWMATLFAIGCVIMGALAFGNEFQQKTLSLLLSQPIPRTSIWKEKMLVLGVVMGAATAVSCIALLFFEAWTFSNFWVPGITLGAVALCAFCTTPWWTLQSRNTLLGVMCALGTPWILILLFSALVSDLIHPRPWAEASSGTALLIAYCIAGYWLGYTRFRKLQDVAPLSQELGIPARLETVLLRPFRAASAGFTGPFASLVKKEFRLQQISFLSAGVFCVVAVAGALLYQCHFTVGRDNNLAMPIFALDFSIYPLLLPFIAGAIGVAEEKAWGVADWHMTLPPSALKQWSIKMLITLSTSLIVGLLLPAGLLLAGHSLAPAELPESFILNVPIVIGQLLLTSVVFYAASLSSTTLRAILLAFGMLFIAGCLMKIGGMITFEYLDIGRQMAFRLGDVRIQIANAFWGDRFPTEKEIAGLVSVEMAVLLCLLHRFAYTSYRDRGLTVGRRTIQPMVLAFAVCFLTAVFMVLGGPFRQ